MNILYACSEASPFISSGGLADVAGSLPFAISGEKVNCRVILPFYSTIPRYLRESAVYIKNFTVPLGWRMQYCGLFSVTIDPVTFYFIDNEYYFGRSKLYGCHDDGERFAFFSKAVLETLMHMDYTPDIIHCNDWHTALIPVYLNTFYRGDPKTSRIKTVFTIHNIAYQGRFALESGCDICGLPPEVLPALELDGSLNFMKGAVENADAVSTVSPTYADEILTPEYSFGMDSVLRRNCGKLCGILNGINTRSFDPYTDQSIFRNYSASSLSFKAVNKSALQILLGLEVSPDTPLIAMVTRLVEMKGLDLVRNSLGQIMQLGVQFAVLGTGDRLYEDLFTRTAQKFPRAFSFTKGFDTSLARKIYAGADIFLMPSKSEPCGLAQMIAMRYGTLPIVRETGGLKDSVSDLQKEGGSGFTFRDFDASEMTEAVKRALLLYRSPKLWNNAVRFCMSQDLSWEKSAGQYICMYENLLRSI